MDEVDEMIRAVDDGDGLLDYGEFVNLIQKHWKTQKLYSVYYLKSIKKLPTYISCYILL